MLTNCVDPASHCPRWLQVCKNDAQISRALTAWANYSSSNPDPSVEYNMHQGNTSSQGTLKHMWAKASVSNQAPAQGASSAAQQRRPPSTQQDQMGQQKASTASDVSALRHATQSDDPVPARKRTRLNNSRAGAGQVDSTIDPDAVPSSLQSLPVAAGQSQYPAAGISSTHSATADDKAHAAADGLQPAAAKDAFSAMMSAAKQPKDVIASTRGLAKGKRAQSAQGQLGGSGWRGALQRIAQDPLR